MKFKIGAILLFLVLICGLMINTVSANEISDNPKIDSNSNKNILSTTNTGQNTVTTKNTNTKSTITLLKGKYLK